MICPINGSKVSVVVSNDEHLADRRVDWSMISCKGSLMGCVPSLEVMLGRRPIGVALRRLATAATIPPGQAEWPKSYARPDPLEPHLEEDPHPLREMHPSHEWLLTRCTELSIRQFPGWLSTGRWPLRCCQLDEQVVVRNRGFQPTLQVRLPGVPPAYPGRWFSVPPAVPLWVTNGRGRRVQNRL